MKIFCFAVAVISLFATKFVVGLPHQLHEPTTAMMVTTKADEFGDVSSNQTAKNLPKYSEEQIYVMRLELFHYEKNMRKYGRDCDLYRDATSNSSSNYIETLVKQFPLSPKEACGVTVACYLTRRSSQDKYCHPVLDAVGTCFPETRAGVKVSLSCPSEIDGISYNIADNVTRDCLQEGVWAGWSNYSCRPIIDENILCSSSATYISPHSDKTNDETCEVHLFRLAVISYVGRGLSLLALLLTFLIFWTLRSIRCWRIIIHWNLASSLILRNIMWIFLHCFVSYDARRNNAVYCRVLVTLFNYAQVASYFWMFVEGLYLHMMIVLAYTSDRFKLRTYMLVGWGVPVPIMGLWVTMKILWENEHGWMPNPELPKKVDLFFQIPILFILFVNAVILANIIRILFTKLRQMRGVSRRLDYIKAVKAALFLFPLLGFTYVIFLVSPQSGSTAEYAFWYFNIVLQSCQGVFVCVIYCFVNGEIQSAIGKTFQAWKRQRRFPCMKTGRRYSSASLSRSYNTQVSRIPKSSEGATARSLVTPSQSCTEFRASVVKTQPNAAPQCHLAAKEDEQSAIMTEQGGAVEV